MKNVLLIDSGSGGINILKECLKVCPHCNFLMFCDNKNLPYGGKTKRELIEITSKNLDHIREFFKFDIVVFACNTLTSTCIQFCREKYDGVEFVGTVPAIKPALLKYNEEDIVVIATKATIEHNILISKHPSIKCVEMAELATLIDENLEKLEGLQDYLTERLGTINSVKALVLGCTHYVAVKGIINRILPNVELFDSSNGVARRLKSLVEVEADSFQVKLMTSDSNSDAWAKFWDYLNKTTLEN